MSDSVEHVVAATGAEEVQKGEMSLASPWEKAFSQTVETIDGQSYFLGEVPQSFLADPQAFLPLNSDKLQASVHGIEHMNAELSFALQEEGSLLQRFQKQIAMWEERIEKNRATIEKNLQKIKQNLTDISYDKKNRDYWVSRAEQVSLDYTHAAAGNREADWGWLIKKYGLKNPQGVAIDTHIECVEELCNGAISNLAGEYTLAGNKYEVARKEKEEMNVRMLRENGHLRNSNDALQGYISHAYAHEVEPLQDGVLLYKEFGVKLAAFDKETATYGDLRLWAEGFLDAFLRTNPRVKQHVVTEFRRLASIPLPASHS